MGARLKTVLIVDDEKLFLRSLSTGLEPYSEVFQVLTAENGRQAVGLLAAREIDLVITDIKMPEMGGLQLLAHILRHHPRVPVMLMTAFGTPEMERTV
jgi:YesN/AraC family two-component response regulator